MAALYQVENPFTKVLQGVKGASASLARMGQERKQETKQEPGAGQGLMDAAGVGLAGYQVYKGSGLGDTTTPIDPVDPALMPPKVVPTAQVIPAGEAAAPTLQGVLPISEAAGQLPAGYGAGSYGLFSGVPATTIPAVGALGAAGGTAGGVAGGGALGTTAGAALEFGAPAATAALGYGSGAAAGGVAGGASGGAVAGSVVPGVGTVLGAVLGLAATALFG